MTTRLLRDLREQGACELFADRFLIEREVGFGGMGLVYRAIDQSSGSVVALKLLRKTDDAAKHRFVQEVEALKRLSHPGVVRLVAHGGMGTAEGYLAMEWVEGPTLSERLEQGALGVEETMALARRLASALEAAHALGLVHRDIKPTNILLPGGRVDVAKVADFGLSRFEGEARVTSSGTGLGTPGYAAPEQIRGIHDLDGRADLFSLGCVLYRCLTDREAFEGAEPLTVIAKLVLEEPPPLRTLRHDVPAALDDLVFRLLEKDRDRRIASARATIEALDRIHHFARSPERAAAWRWRRSMALLVAVSLGLGLGWRTLARQPAREPARAPRAPTATAAKTLLTDLQASSICKPEAVRAYREGLLLLRDATSERAHIAFVRAKASDPACPEAMLRLLQTSERTWSIQDQREQLRQTLAMRDALSERDRVLLDSRVATLATLPADRAGSAEILRQGARRFPDDAELAHLAARASLRLANTVGEVRPVLELARRAVEIDPGYADAWQSLGWAHDRLRQTEEATSAYDHCLELSPGAGDCIAHRINALRREGRCAESSHWARLWMARDPTTTRAHRLLLVSVAAEGQPRELLEQVAQQRWAGLPENKREVVRLSDRAKMAASAGRFDEALRLGEELERHVASDPNAESHARVAHIVVEALLEMGRAAEAANRAQQILARRAAWTSSEETMEWIESGAAHYESSLLGIAYGHRLLSRDQWARSTAAWQKEQEDRGRLNAFEGWVLRWGSIAGGRNDARAALEEEPNEAAESAPAPTLLSFYVGFMEAFEGRIRLLAGDAVRAEPLLDAAARSCQGLAQPFLNTRAHLWLGMAHEELEHTREACEAYGVVRRRWGQAVPRSVTAEEAARRGRALGCAP
jgi:tetratricopeptide (TPR) repeat protein